MNLEINGASVDLSPDAAEAPLLYALRNALGLRATRFGCGTERCGACMVLVDGVPTYSCTLPADAVGERSVTTLEGIVATAPGRLLLDAFVEEQAAQCGYCISGILVAAEALLRANPRPDRAAVVAALEPHLCRCGAQPRVIRAILKAAERRGAQ